MASLMTRMHAREKGSPAMSASLPARLISRFSRANSSAAGREKSRLFSKEVMGHTGFTGTSIWIDPEQNFYIILLTNRVHPTRDNPKIGRVRANFADAAVRDFIRHDRADTGPPAGIDR